MFNGRIGVKQYWQAAIVLIIINVLVSIALFAGVMVLSTLLISSASNPMEALPLLLLFAVLGGAAWMLPSLVMFLFVLGLQVRRFHDFGLTAWTLPALFLLGWASSFFFPVFEGGYVTGSTAFPEISSVGAGVALLLFVVGFALLCWPGTKGPNKYGEVFQYRSVWAAIRGSKAPPRIQ